MIYFKYTQGAGIPVCLHVCFDIYQVMKLVPQGFKHVGDMDAYTKSTAVWFRERLPVGKTSEVLEDTIRF
jgi:hypothetical protein